MVGPQQASPADSGASKTDTPQSREKNIVARKTAAWNRRDLQWELIKLHYGAASGNEMWGTGPANNAECQIRAIIEGGWCSAAERAALDALDEFDSVHGTALAA